MSSHVSSMFKKTLIFLYAQSDFFFKRIQYGPEIIRVYENKDSVCSLCLLEK